MERISANVWDKTWTTPLLPGEDVVVRVEVDDESRTGEERTVTLDVQLRDAEELPSFSKEGVVSAASFDFDFETSTLETVAPVTAGGMVTIFGTRLAEQEGEPEGFPLPTTLQDTIVRIQGRRLPLLFVSGTQANGLSQINGIVPFDEFKDAENNLLQMFVERNTKISLPVYVNLGASQPAIFRFGKSLQAHVYRHPDNKLAGPSSLDGEPVERGGIVVILCAGLGPVIDPNDSDVPVLFPDARQAASDDPLLWTVEKPTVRIGGQEAQLISHSLAPGFSAVYQINAFVPENSDTGDQVPISIEIGGQASPQLTIAVQ